MGAATTIMHKKSTHANLRLAIVEEKDFFFGSNGIGKLSLNWEWCDFGVNRCSVYIERSGWYEQRH